MFCSRCGNQFEGTPVFCSECGLKLAAEPAPRSWFRRNPNWTLVIAFLLTEAVYFIVVSIADHYIAEENADLATLLITVSLTIPLAIVGGWVLKQKGRSLWWLLLVLMPYWFVGCVVWLALDNKRQMATSWQTVSAVNPPVSIETPLSPEAVESEFEAEQEEETCCPKCGSRVPEESKFCLKCGTRLFEDAHMGPWARWGMALLIVASAVTVLAIALGKLIGLIG